MGHLDIVHPSMSHESQRLLSKRILLRASQCIADRQVDIDESGWNAIDDVNKSNLAQRNYDK